MSSWVAYVTAQSQSKKKLSPHNFNPMRQQVQVIKAPITALAQVFC